MTEEKSIETTFDDYLLKFKEFRKIEQKKGVDMEPFRMPLFSQNLAKRYIILKKYRTITKYLLSNRKTGKALDFGTGFGAFLPILSRANDTVIAVDAFDDQLRVVSDLTGFLNLKNVTISKVSKDNGLANFQDCEFDTILEADVLEHNLDYQGIIRNTERILKPKGLLIISLPTEHLLYRMFARREVERDQTRGHVYHSFTEEQKVEKFITDHFELVKFSNILTFFHVLFLRKSGSQTKKDDLDESCSRYRPE